MGSFGNDYPNTLKIKNRGANIKSIKKHRKVSLKMIFFGVIRLPLKMQRVGKFVNFLKVEILSAFLLAYMKAHFI